MTRARSQYPQLEAIVGWARYSTRQMDRDAIAKWVETLGAVGRDTAWIASEQRIGSIPRILSPQDTEAFMGTQFGTYQQLARSSSSWS